MRRRHDEPEPQAFGLLEHGRSGRLGQPDRVESELPQQAQRLPLVLDDPREDRPIVDQEDRTRQLDPPSPRGLRRALARRRNTRHRLGRRYRHPSVAGRRSSGRLGTTARAGNVAGDVQIVDPHIGHARTAVNVQEDLLDRRFSGVQPWSMLCP
jgi:hypothetical protein